MEAGFDNIFESCLNPQKVFVCHLNESPDMYETLTDSFCKHSEDEMQRSLSTLSRKPCPPQQRLHLTLGAMSCRVNNGTRARRSPMVAYAGWQPNYIQYGDRTQEDGLVETCKAKN